MVFTSKFLRGNWHYVRRSETNGYLGTHPLWEYY